MQWLLTIIITIIVLIIIISIIIISSIFTTGYWNISKGLETTKSKNLSGYNSSLAFPIWTSIQTDPIVILCPWGVAWIEISHTIGKKNQDLNDGKENC